MRPLIWVLVGGAVGAPLRYVVDRFVNAGFKRDWPWGTLLVNLSGAFLFALLLGIAPPSEVFLTFVGVGLLGTYTTWSAFAVELVELFKRRRHLSALAYLTATFIGGIAAAYAGFAVAIS
jgi:fluoride exporter